VTGSHTFFEFREPRFLWGGARLFGTEVASSDFYRLLLKPGRYW
jgi:hypothetical protein